MEELGDLWQFFAIGLQMEEGEKDLVNIQIFF